MPNNTNTSTSTTLEITHVKLEPVVNLSTEQKILYGNHETAITNLSLTSAGIRYTFNPKPLAQTNSSIIYQLSCSKGSNPDLVLKIIPKTALIKKSIHLFKPLYESEAKHSYQFGLSPSNKLHEDDGNFYLPMFKIPGVELFNFIKEYKTKRNLPLETGLAIIGYMLEAVANCHAERVLHRDIKPENMILNLNDKKITLIDYGFAIPIKNSETHTSAFRCGSKPYTAPEGTTEKPRYSFYSDVYAAGICIGFINDCFDEKANPSIINLLKIYYHMMINEHQPEKRYLTHHYLLIHAWMIKTFYVKAENTATHWTAKIIKNFFSKTNHLEYADFIVDLIDPFKQVMLEFKEPAYIPTPLLTKMIAFPEEQGKQKINPRDISKHLEALTTIARYLLKTPTASSDEKQTAKCFNSFSDKHKTTIANQDKTRLNIGKLGRDTTITDYSGFWYHPLSPKPSSKSISSQNKHNDTLRP